MDGIPDLKVSKPVRNFIGSEAFFRMNILANTPKLSLPNLSFTLSRTFYDVKIPSAYLRFLGIKALKEAAQ
jgi:hypothetical protein